VSIKQRAEKLKRDIPALFLALGNSKTPPAAKIFAGIAVAYALSPVDLIPDFIPVLGMLDDVVILPLLVGLALKLIPENVLCECRAKSEGMWQDGKPKRWYYSIPIILVWLIVVIVIVKFSIFSNIAF